MKTRLPCPWPLLSLLGWLALTPSALAQRSTDDPYQYPDEEDAPRKGRDPDAPYSYPDDDAPVDSGPQRKAARRPEETDRDFREAGREDGEKKEKGFRHLAGVDDPNKIGRAHV